MKLLLDENLPHKLRLEIPGHDVLTVLFMGWLGIENGELLALAAKTGFDTVLTTDRGMEYEQDSGNRPVSVIIIRAQSNAIEDIRPLIPQLLKALENPTPKSLVKIEAEHLPDM
jgi:predicted nuclease of predicted toxin-antitoxin system